MLSIMRFANGNTLKCVKFYCDFQLASFELSFKSPPSVSLLFGTGSWRPANPRWMFSRMGRGNITRSRAERKGNKKIMQLNLIYDGVCLNNTQ